MVQLKRARRAPRHTRVGCLGAVSGLTCLVLLLVHTSSARAFALSPIPVSPVTVAVPVAKAIATAPLKAVVSALLSILEALFGGIEAKLLTGVIKGLLAIPNFDTGHVAGLEQTTDAIAIGMLSAVLTLSILRYYLAGLSDSGAGGFEAIQGLIRVVGAVGFIILWPAVFGVVLEIPKMFDSALLTSGTVQKNVALLFEGALVIGVGVFTVSSGLGLIFVALMGCLAAIVFIALLWMKVLLAVLMMFLYVSMPLCVVLWPVPELAWLANAAMRSLFVGMLVPCVWAILFALCSAVNADVLTWAPSHSPIDTVIVRPLAGITLMLLCITVPRFLMRTAMIGPQGQARGGWRIWRTVTFGLFAMRGASGVARTVAAAASEGHPTAQRMIDRLPRQAQPPATPGEGSLAGRVIFGRAGFSGNESEAKPRRPAAATPDTQASEQTGSEDAPAVASDREHAASAIRRQEAGFSIAGIDRAPYDRAMSDRAWQAMQRRSKLAPADADAVAAAMRAFTPETQRGIATFSAANPTRMRQWAAQHVHAPNLSDGQRSALLTLGSAPQGALEQGIRQATARLAAEEHAATSQPQASTSHSARPARQDVQPPPGHQPPQQPSTEGRTPDGSAPPPLSGPPPESGTGGAELPQQPDASREDTPRSPLDPPESEPFLD